MGPQELPPDPEERDELEGKPGVASLSPPTVFKPLVLPFCPQTLFAFSGNCLNNLLLLFLSRLGAMERDDAKLPRRQREAPIR
jgi:hypothetical protein